MKLSTFNTLKRIMQLTTSDSDAEALSAIRKANAMLAAESPPVDWARVLERSVQIEVAVEAAPDAEGDGSLPQRASSRAQADNDVEGAFRTVYDGELSGSFKEFIDSLHEQWERNHRLSSAQRDSLFKAAARARR